MTLIIGFFFTLFSAVLSATIGYSISFTGFFEMITGAPSSASRSDLNDLNVLPAYIQPGYPVANMYGALYGTQPMGQALWFLSDLKLGIYVKLAPRVTFSVQIVGMSHAIHSALQRFILGMV